MLEGICHEQPQSFLSNALTATAIYSYHDLHIDTQSLQNYSGSHRCTRLLSLNTPEILYSSSSPAPTCWPYLNLTGLWIHCIIQEEVNVARHA